jgi:hypothetical protein
MSLPIEHLSLLCYGCLDCYWISSLQISFHHNNIFYQRSRIHGLLRQLKKPTIITWESQRDEYPITKLLFSFPWERIFFFFFSNLQIKTLNCKLIAAFVKIMTLKTNLCQIINFTIHKMKITALTNLQIVNSFHQVLGLLFL